MEIAYLLRSALLGALGLVGLPAPAAADPPTLTVSFGAGAPAPRPTPPTDPTAACPGAVTVLRAMGGGREEMSEPLLDCDRRPRDQARVLLSLLARPRELPRPSDDALEAFDRSSAPGHLAENVALLHPALLDRLQRLSDALEGRPIELLSGYRPSAAATSRHHHGRALDLRVRGISRARVRDVLVSFDHTGVGWYPNSTFVHLDVRERATYWVDESGPGQPAQYVRGARPPTPPAPQPAGSGAAPSGSPAPRRGPNRSVPTTSDLRSIQDETAAALSQIHIDPI